MDAGFGLSSGRTIRGAFIPANDSALICRVLRHIISRRTGRQSSFQGRDGSLRFAFVVRDLLWK